ncbi:dihydrolipoyl dehydrogenase [Devosia pacifica]|uniref:Dihydrolipoyl dehydrogenase n=1 Tax=Devosia pacifica TaxID=1335967 RepID=A0A918S2H4_9HYPH|nr:dihydrolipoyl dehydrogenase [Devosia pacifica]GHA21263.1 dihydrolipoyl dehydrogenase [Devosia pacifica]
MSQAQNLTCDVAVIGAGTAGLAAAHEAQRAGKRLLLIDDKFEGTVCAHVGCMPSKLLIAASRTAHGVTVADTFGVHVTDWHVDGSEVMARVRRERDKFVAATKKSFADFPEDSLIKARARFSSPGTLVLDDGRAIEAKAIVIATGATAQVPPPLKPIEDRILTNRNVFELTQLPKSLAVVGGGALGLELAQAFSRLGVEVTIFDRSTQIGGIADEEAQQELQSCISNELTLRLGVDVDAEASGEGATLSWSGASSGKKTFEKVLVAAGRKPQLEDLALENSGLALDDKGVPVFDPQTMRCDHSAIYMAGDSDGSLPVLHEASAEGRIAGRNAALHPDAEQHTRMPAFSMVFSEPNAAVVGEPPQSHSLIGRSSYQDQGRAKVDDRAYGIVKIYARPGDGMLTGATVVAPGGEHLAHLLAWCIGAGLTASQVLNMPFYHPTLEEGLRSGLRQICDQAPDTGEIDRNTPPGV